MSVAAILPPKMPTRKLGAVTSRIQDVGHANEEPLSVFLGRGVVRRSDGGGNHNVLGADLAKYQLVRPGDLVFNRLRTWQGGFGASEYHGIVSPAYIVLRPHDADARFLQYVLLSRPYLAELTRLSKWMPPSQFDILWTDLKTLEVPYPTLREQRRIADFLDARVTRIDQIISGRVTQNTRLEDVAVRLSYETVTGTHLIDRRPSRLTWTHTLPADWPVLTVGSQFEVELGKMLNDSRQTGVHATPYLRNTNVQWDEVDTSDIKSMDIAPGELSRYSVRSGDLLVCEGGQPGRAAIWDGRVEEMGYQKALHRARSRGRSRAEWLLECLRVCVNLNVFAVENGQATIGHLTNEQLRATRFPFPEPAEQTQLVTQLAAARASVTGARRAIESSVERLIEYKQSLITAAVTGEFDVTTASTQIPGE